MLRTLLTGALAGALLAPIAPAAPASAAPAPRKIVHAEWTSGDDFRTGVLQGTGISRGRLVVDRPVGTRSYAGRRYDVARWVSLPWQTT